MIDAEHGPAKAARATDQQGPVIIERVSK